MWWIFFSGQIGQERRQKRQERRQKRQDLTGFPSLSCPDIGLQKK
jgi:hypothetical protein